MFFLLGAFITVLRQPTPPPQQATAMTMRDGEGQSTKRTPYGAGVLLITCIIVAAVVIPVALLIPRPPTSSSTSSSDGEIL
jgi:hypothetical protein